MPTWSEILREVSQTPPSGEQGPLDLVRRKYLRLLYEHTGRNTIIYASKWNIPDTPPAESLLVNEEDVQAFMEVLHGLRGQKLDLILHSPGGTAEAAEAIVHYLRTKFTEIRILVPYAALSAATMWACSANRIVMGKHSYLGPIDPQMPVGGPMGFAPAQAILDQFELAKRECSDPSRLPPWAPILEQYGPALIVQCREQIALSRELVGKWLRTYMFAGAQGGARRALKVSKALAKHETFRSHGRHIDREQCRTLGGKGLVVDDLEADQQLQDLVLSVYHATTITFTGTQCVKVVENHLGKAFLKVAGPPPVAEPAPISPPGSAT